MYSFVKASTVSHVLLQLEFKFKVFGCKWSFETSVGGKNRNVIYDTLRPVTRFFANVLFGKEMVIRLLKCEDRLLCSGALGCSAPFLRCKFVFCRQRPVWVWCTALQPLMGVVLCDLALIATQPNLWKPNLMLCLICLSSVGSLSQGKLLIYTH